MEKILDFSPIGFVHRITPRPCLIITTSGRDVVHPAWSMAEMYAASREPKRVEFLPFAQTELYAEPGLTVSNGVAVDFFADALGPAE